GGTYALVCALRVVVLFFFSSRRRHTRLVSDWSSDVCSSDLVEELDAAGARAVARTEIATWAKAHPEQARQTTRLDAQLDLRDGRSEERRVGKEGRSRWAPDRSKKNTSEIMSEQRADGMRDAE